MNAIRTSLLTLATSLTLGCCRKREKEEVIHIPGSKDYVRAFHGEDGYPVKRWISDIESSAEVMSWSKLQQFEFALTSLRGLAKEYVESQENVKTWEELKMLLLKKFDSKEHLKAVLNLLKSRRKMEDESLEKYVEEMRNIGGQANLKPKVISQYIIDGLDDSLEIKEVLRGAETFSEFEEKVKLYKEVKINAEAKRQNLSKGDTSVPNRENCSICGILGHNSSNCSSKQLVHIDTPRRSRMKEMAGIQPSVWSNRTCPSFPERESYIIQGEDAPEGQFPYMLSLNFLKTKAHACGASVLTKDWALTAAHCCDTGHEMYLYSGSNYLSKGGKDHKIELMIKHENYKPKSFWKNDICLIKVKDPFVLGKTVQKITLPSQGTPVNDGERVTITGWGYLKPDEKKIPDKLQLGKNFIALSPNNCYSHTAQIHESYLCVMGGKKGQGVCNGDSGSPLVKNGVQLGIASWVYKPCACGLPDFYARVPTFVDWIKKNMGKDADELQFAK